MGHGLGPVLPAVGVVAGRVGLQGVQLRCWKAVAGPGDQLVDPYALLLADHPHQVHIAQDKIVLDQGLGVLADDNAGFVHLVEALQARAQVDLVPQHPIGEAVARAQVADQHGAGVDPGARVQHGAPGRGPLRGHLQARVAHVQGRLAGPFGVVGVVDGRPEKGHDLVADVLFEGAALLEDLLGHAGEILAEDLDHLGRPVALRVAREALQVRKEHRQHLLLSAQFELVGVFEHLLDDQGGHVLPEGALDPAALALHRGVAEHGDEAVADRQRQERVDHVQPQAQVHEEPAGHEDVQGKEAQGDDKSGGGLHPREIEAGQQSDEDDGHQVEDLGPMGLGDEAAGQDVVDDVGVDLHPRKHRAQGGGAQVVGADGRGADQHDAVREGAGRRAAVQDVGDRIVGKGFGGTQVVDAHLPVFVGGNETGAHLDARHTVARHVDDQLGPVQKVPGAQHRQVGKELLTAAEHQRHAPHHPVPVAGHGEEARGVGGIGQDLQVGLRGVGRDEGPAGRIGVLLEDQGIGGVLDQGQLPVDFGLADVVVQTLGAHVEKIAQDRGRPGL